ncbi:MAG: GNAT family protein [Anaerolineales bacterium]|jgi:RimJ/RimL family protein N-acetyltransferase
MDDLFTGKLVRLAGIDPDEVSNSFAQWNRDSEYMRLLDSDPPHLRSSKSTKEWMEKELENNTEMCWFAVRALEDDRLLGDITLSVVDWGSRNAFMGIGIGAREFWGKGYGTDAIELLLRYAFTELNLRRVSLNVFEFNERAIRSYEKVGFRLEGRERQVMQREGRRWDIIDMGILKEEWMENYGDNISD